MTDTCHRVPACTGLNPVFLGRELSNTFSSAFAAEDQFNLILEISADTLSEEHLSRFLIACIHEEENPFLLCMIAEHFLTELNDLEPAHMALHKAEGVLDASRLIACPLTRWKVFCDKSTAYHTMKSYTQVPQWLSYCEQLQMQGVLDVADLYADLGGSAEQLSEILDQAGRLALSATDYYQCSERYRKLLPESPRREQMLKRTELAVEEIFDWYDVILQYSIEERYDDVKRCLAKAMERAETFSDWAYLAGMVRHTSSDADLFKQCMEKAEALAETPENWRSCSKTWDTYFSKDEAIRCRRRAEKLETGTK